MKARSRIQLSGGRLGRYRYYKTKDGEDVEISSSEIKKTIMKANNWTAEEYRKNYDIFKNKLRAYESFRESHGASQNERQNVVDVLYREAKAKLRYGSDYAPSQKMQQIRGFSAYSITKGRKMISNSAYQKRQTEKYDAYVSNRFDGLIAKNAQAQRLSDKYADDPIEREKVLSAYADALKLYINEQGKVEEGNGIPYSGEAYGSDTEIEFDDEAVLQ